MESNEQNELTRKIETDSQMERRMKLEGELMGRGVEQKGLLHMDMDNSVVIAGERGNMSTLLVLMFWSSSFKETMPYTNNKNNEHYFTI